VENAYAYDAFENLRGQAGELLNRILYTGQQYDQEMGQYYLRARYYNPVVGRFTQEDVYRGDGLNLYAYCANNPVTYYDPSGYSTDNIDPCGNKGAFGDSDEEPNLANDTGNTVSGVDGRTIEIPSGYETDFEDLAKYRESQGMPVAGSADDKHTAGKLIIDDNEYYGRNGHGQQAAVKDAFNANAQTATHAEGQVFYNAYTDGAQGTSATLITDRAACGACGYSGGIRSMAKQMGITDLTVVSPNNPPINFNPQVKPNPNPFPAPVKKK